MMAGVGAGTGAMSSVLGKLAALLSDEYKLLKSVRKEIAFLERELRRMQILVNTLADMEKLDDLAKDWKGTMRDLSYDMEDCIDRFMDRLGNGDAKSGFMKRTARRLKTLFARHGIGTQIKELKARVAEESERRQRLNLDNYVTSSSRTTVEIDPRLPAFHQVVKDLVAIDGRRDLIVSWLRENSLELKVVAIFGGGGLGKTTLAMEVYRRIKGDFQRGACVSVSRTPDLDQLLKDILSQIDEEAFSKCQMERWKIDRVIREIRRILTGKRYFIVIDDVWKQEHWAIFKGAFPDTDNGSRIIATTRNTNVAKSCCSNSSDQLYQMAALNDVDSGRLFFNRIFHSNNLCPPQLENISAKILKKCAGVPLAIITIASLLANKPQNIGEWKRLEDSIGTGLSYENDVERNGMKDILLFSYWDLPHHLKTCLLYLCIYPEDHRIKCEDLKWKWIAEGFVAAPWGDLSQEADNYFNELVNRSLIHPVSIDYDECVEYCQVHDMVLDLIISLSEEENFATILNGRVCNSLPSKIRRLSMQSSRGEQKRAIHQIKTSKLHVRSVNVFGKTEQLPPLVDFHSLRVLDLSGRDNWLENKHIVIGSTWLKNKHIKDIGSLCQLRYLLLSGWISKLPEEIGDLQHLETLDLRGCKSLKTLPSTIVRLQKLVRLFIHRWLCVPVDVIGSMQALEEVSDICTIDNPEKFAEELGHLTKLRRLSMHYYPSTRYKEDYVERYLELLGSSLSQLCQYNLRYFHTDAKTGYYLFSDPSHTFPHPQVIKISGTIQRVPKGMTSLNDVANLDICLPKFDEKGLHLLMGMPSLTHLKLTVEVSITDDPAFRGGFSFNPLTVGSDGFKLLKVFSFTFKGCEGTGITFGPGAMPALRRLHLCWEARDVMSGGGAADMGIEHLSGLANLEVVSNCYRVTVANVEGVEGSLEKAIALHPNRHNLHVRLHRISDHEIYKDEGARSHAWDLYRCEQMVGAM